MRKQKQRGAHAKVQEVAGAVLHAVELLRVLEFELVLHVRLVVHTAEVVVPTPLRRCVSATPTVFEGPGAHLFGDHEKPVKAVAQQHLHLLRMRREVSRRVVARVLVVSAPLVAGRGQFVRG